MPPKNLFLAIARGARSTLAPPFTFAARLITGAPQSARKKPDHAQWTLELLKRLEWRRFEEVCAAYFEELGFKGAHAGVGADGSSAIKLYQRGSERTAILVQCLPWSVYHVGVKAVRALHGAMASADAGEGVLVTPGKFTPEARVFARTEKISLIDGVELVAKIAALPPEKALALLEFATQGDYRTPTCPSCGIKMVSRKSTTHGRAHWGCHNYPACKHTFFEP